MPKMTDLLADSPVDEESEDKIKEEEHKDDTAEGDTGDDKEVDDTKDDKPDPIVSIQDSLSALNDSIQTLNERVGGIEEQVTKPEEEEDKEEDKKPYSGTDGQPTDWHEVRTTAQEDARRVAREELENKEKESKAQLEAEENARKAIDKDFNDQLAELEKDGVIPTIEKDPDRKVRKELFGLSASMGSINLRKVGKYLSKMHEAGLRYDIKTGELMRSKTSGINNEFPVGSSSARGTTGKAPIDYKTLHGMGIDQLVDRFNNE